MDDEPMWVADRVVALTPSSATTISETAKEFAIKGNHLTLIQGNQFDAKTWLDELNEGTIKTWDELRTAFINRFFPPALFDRLLGEIRAFSQHENETLTDAWLFLNAAAGGIFLYKTPNQAYQLLKDKVLLKLDWEKNQKPKSSLKKIVAFVDEGSRNSNTDKIMARMDAMAIKMDAQYKDFQTRSKFNRCRGNHTTTDCNDDDTPMDDDEDEEPMPQPKVKDPEPIKEIPTPKPYKPKIPYRQRLRKEKMEAQYGMPNYGKFLKELVSNKHKLKQISSTFLSDDSSAIIQNKFPLKLGDPGSFLIPCTFSKTFSYNALAYLGASINLMPYSLYAKLSLETLKPTKMSVRLAYRSFQYPIGITKNMLVKVGKFTFLIDFVILEMEEDSKIPLILRRPSLHTANAVIRVKQNNSILDIDVIDEILEEDFEALLNEGSKILYSIEGTPFEDKIFAEFDEFIATNIEENSELGSDEKEPPFEKITFNTDYKMKTSLKEPPMDLELKPLHDHLEYAFLEEPSFLQVIISSYLSEQNKNRLVSVLKNHKQAFAWKTIDIHGICLSFCKHKIQLLDDKKPVVQKQRRLNPNMQEVVKKMVKLLDTGIIYPIADSLWIFPNTNRPCGPRKKTFTCPFGTYAYRRMPFGLCKAPATLQRCMLPIFHDMIEESVEVFFMDDFSVFGNSFNNCLNNLDKMLQRCKDANLVLNWEKCHFMVKEGIVLGHKVSGAGLEVDKAKIDIISKLPPLLMSKALEIF
ncbi:reverse transcriptase domain-containing protein [Tanacetum coccineum]